MTAPTTHPYYIGRDFEKVLVTLRSAPSDVGFLAFTRSLRQSVYKMAEFLTSHYCINLMWCSTSFGCGAGRVANNIKKYVQFLMCEIDKAERRRLSDMRGGTRLYKPDDSKTAGAVSLHPCASPVRTSQKRKPQESGRNRMVSAEPKGILYNKVHYLTPELFSDIRGATRDGDERREAVRNVDNYSKEERLVWKGTPNRFGHFLKQDRGEAFVALTNSASFWTILPVAKFKAFRKRGACLQHCNDLVELGILARCGGRFRQPRCFWQGLSTGVVCCRYCPCCCCCCWCWYRC